jgi:hypothetical protein
MSIKEIGLEPWSWVREGQVTLVGSLSAEFDMSALRKCRCTCMSDA